jgi:hypothetical protein
MGDDSNLSPMKRMSG